LTVAGVLMCVGPVVAEGGDGQGPGAGPSQRPYHVQETVARGRLQEALRRLDAFLSRGAADNRDRWRRYVRWDQLSKWASPGERPTPEELQQLGNVFFADHRGLELAPFADVRESLRGFYDVVQAVEDPEFGAKLERQALDYPQLLQAYLTDPHGSAADQVGVQLARFERLGAVPDLVRQTRAAHIQPNLHVFATSAFIASGLTSPIDDTQPIRDVILGTQIHGWGRTVGQLTARLEPCDTHARIRLLLSGQTHSTSVGYNGPVVIDSRGVTQVQGDKLICVDVNGLSSAPATACCSTHSTICSISANRKFGHRLIERVASRRAGSQKAQAEAIASDHAEHRVASNLDQRTLGFLSEANAKYESKFRQALARRRALPQQMHFRTSSDHLQVTALHALPDQLAASGPPPAISNQSDVTLQLHDSYVTNMGEAMVGGVKLTDQRLYDLLLENKQSVPEELKPSEDKDPWSITFARQRPVTMKVNGMQVRLAIRGQKFTRGNQELDRLMEISAVYDVHPTGDGVKLTRVGEIDVDFPGREGQRLGVSEVAFRTLMRTKFSALFKEEIRGEGIDLPGRWARRGKMRLHEIQSQDRWLALGWK